MSTALDIIKDALELIGVLGAGDTPSNEDAATALRSLNLMIDAWCIEELNIFCAQNDTFTATANTASFNIATGQTWNATRPVRIDYAFVRDANGYDSPLQIITNEEYQAITDKDAAGSAPTMLYYNPAYPTGIVYLYPVQNVSVTIGLTQWKKLTSFALLTTAVSLSEGYEVAFAYNLAVEVAPKFGAPLTQVVIDRANQYKANLKSHNIKPIYLQNEMCAFGIGGSTFNAYSGE